MRDIEKTSKIKAGLLDSEHYFQSLLEQAYMSGILPDKQLEKIQFDCLTLLAGQTERYNSGDGSSIRIEAAQGLMASIMFTIGVWLKTCSSPGEALQAVQKDGIYALYQKGRERIGLLIGSTKILHCAIMDNLADIETEFYRSTIVDAIKGFFKLYNPEFAAQEIHITADYPVHHRMEGLLGIEFIRRYLECIYYENLFCSRFSAKDMHNLLCGYDEHYQQLPFNVYEVALSAAIGCVLSGGDARRLVIAPRSMNILNGMFCGKNRVGIERILVTALGRLSVHLGLPGPLKSYLDGSLPQIAAAIENAVMFKTLDHVFVQPKYPQNDPKTIFPFGKLL